MDHSLRVDALTAQTDLSSTARAGVMEALHARLDRLVYRSAHVPDLGVGADFRKAAGP